MGGQVLNHALLLALPPPPAPFDAEPISSAPNYCPSRQFSNCLSCEESPSHLEQLVDSYLQAEAAFEPSLGTLQTPSHYIPDSFQPVPLCFNQGLVSTVRSEGCWGWGHSMGRSSCKLIWERGCFMSADITTQVVLCMEIPQSSEKVSVSAHRTGTASWV